MVFGHAPPKIIPAWHRLNPLGHLCSPAALSVSRTNDHVVLITIDGLAAFYLADPHAPLPTLRKLAEEGAYAEALRVSNPTTTWPNPTTLVTGVHLEKHSVLLNGLPVRSGPSEPVRIEAERDKGDLVAVPTFYDQLHRLGYRTAAINWPCTRGATKVFFRINKYDPRRAHLAICNWERQPSVAVDMSPLLKAGDEFRVLNPKDFFGSPILTGRAAGPSIKVPMDGEFSAFVVLKE